LNLLDRMLQEGSPLIDGEQVTFAWQGRKPPKLAGDFNHWDWAAAPDWQRAGKGWWKIELPFPADAYMEYAYAAAEDSRPNPEHVPDPYNPRRIYNGVGNYNHYFYMPNAHPTSLTRLRPGAKRGQVTAGVVVGGPLLWNGKRRVHFYRPPVEGACPLVVVWDGQDYLRRAKLPTIVDNLIHMQRITPIALALIENGGRGRMVEYGCNDTTLGYLLERVLPEAGKRLDLLDPREHPGAYGVIGASMGGLMALYTALRAPDIFGHALPQSGAFTIGEYPMVVWDLARAIDPHLLDIWMDAGRYEGLAGCNREMAALLAQRGISGHYNEYAGGHNYTAWRNDLPQGLEYLYGQ
jgi:enterochelin esterase family protein